MLVAAESQVRSFCVICTLLGLRSQAAARFQVALALSSPVTRDPLSSQVILLDSSYPGPALSPACLPVPSAPCLLGSVYQKSPLVPCSSDFIFNYIYSSFCVCIYVHVWRPERHLLELVLAFHHVNPMNFTKVIRLLNCLASSQSAF